MPRRHAKLICDERELPFVERLEMGRESGGRHARPGRAELDDPTISGRHCVVTQDPGGRFFVRDLSRNGTRLEGRRLIPNLEVEIEPGQSLSIGPFTLRLVAEGEVTAGPATDTRQTVMAGGLVIVTLLVGDIRGYTALSQRQDAARLSRAVRRVFAALEERIVAHQGTVKEYQGDAVVAFWEAEPDHPGRHAARAMDAALALDERVRELAAEAGTWPFADFPLRMEFGLATGAVMISSVGRDRPTGLAVVGDAVNMAFRIEKIAGDETGPILVCSTTRRLGGEGFELEDRGEHQLAGREGQERLFSLRGRR